MNIFEYDGEEFDRKLDEIFNKMDSNKLKKELIECGLVIKDVIRIEHNAEEAKYTKKLLDRKIKIDMNEKYNYCTSKNTFEEGNKLWKNQKLLVA